MLWWTLRQLKSSSVGTRKRAVEKLGKSGKPEVVKLLVSAIKDPEFEVRLKGMSALWNIGKVAARKDVTALVDQLVTAARDSNWQVRENAARALGDAGDNRAVETLITLLQDSEGEVRKNAAWSLGEIGDSRAAEPCIAMLNDSDPKVRSAAAETLGKIGDGSAVKPLIAAHKEGHPYVVKDAERALKSICGRLPESESRVKGYLGHVESKRVAEKAEQDSLVQRKIAPVVNMSEPQMIGLLGNLCSAYKADNAAVIAELEPKATAIGELLNHRGGIDEMRHVFHKLEGTPGARTLEMHWGGIGDWRG
jgi:HEAT repeat protein